MSDGAGFRSDLAALAAVESGRDRVSRDDLHAALEDLLQETAALTRVLLGSEAPGEGPVPKPHDWMRGMAGGGFVRVGQLRSSS